MIHTPVLLSQTIENLAIQPNNIVVDGTIGFGGHSSKIIEKLSQEGLLIGLDQDPAAIAHCSAFFRSNNNIVLQQINFKSIKKTLEKQNIKTIDKLVLDLGISSYQLDNGERGFSFLKDEKLDLRMDQKNTTTTAKEIVNDYSSQQLSDIFYQYGELFKNKILVSNIIETRKQKKIETTFQLVSLIKKSYYFNNRRKPFIKTCSQVFQALRIAVNDELGCLSATLPQLNSIMNNNGRVAIISFHSLEDRIVKRYFQQNKTTFKPLTKKPIIASQEEIKENSRARTAKLRVYEKMPAGTRI